MSIQTPPTLTVPFLPTELVDEILRSDELSNQDLARCCLVSRQFLPSARQSLYSSVMLNCYAKKNALPDRYLLAKDSLLLVETLRSSSALRNLVKAVLCQKMRPANRGQSDGIEANGMLEELLQKLPQVQQLLLSHYIFESLWNYTLSQPSRWKILDIRGIEQHFILHANTPFTNLKKLRLGISDSRTLYLPSRLTHLDFCYFERQPSSILNVASSPLRFLRLSTRHFVQSTDFSRLPQLQHLELLNLHKDVDLCKLGGLLLNCRQLTSLAVDYDEWIPLDDLSSLLQLLPTSLLRIDFSYYVPFESLNDLLEKGLLKSVRIIGVSEEGCSEKEVSHGSDTLKRLCDRRGIKLKDIDNAPPVFDF